MLQWRAMILPDRYIGHGSQEDQIEEACLTSKHIADTVLSLIGKNKEMEPSSSGQPMNST